MHGIILRRLFVLGSIALLLALVIGGLFMSSRKAQAEDLDWDWDIHRYKAVHHHHHHRPRSVVRLYREPEFEERNHVVIESDVRDERHCLDHHEDAVSTEHTEAGEAMVSATKLWSARVGFLFGGRFMNWDNAADRKVICDQSNAMDTLSGRIIDNAQKLIGNDGKNQRCFIRAIPCAAPLERAEKEDRR